MMFNRTAAMAVSLMLLLGPVNALAGDFFVGASIGNASLTESFDGLDVDDDSTAWRIVGGWRFNDYFALEGGYHDFGDFKQVFDNGGTQNTATFSADGFTFGAAGSVPLGERFALTGRAGLFFWNGSAEINNVSQATPEDSNLYLGAGASFDVSTKFQLTTDWTRYELENTASGVFSVGMQYSFR